jgi:hypothetical protein
LMPCTCRSAISCDSSSVCVESVSNSCTFSSSIFFSNSAAKLGITSRSNLCVASTISLQCTSASCLPNFEKLSEFNGTSFSLMNSCRNKLYKCEPFFLHHTSALPFKNAALSLQTVGNTCAMVLLVGTLVQCLHAELKKQ